jgi:hypothetical protein
MICFAMLGERCCRRFEDNATNTVKPHTREPCRKLGTTSQAEAVARRRTACSSQIMTRGDRRPALANLGPPFCTLLARMSPQCYRLIVKGELGARDASAFEGMTISAHDGITEMTGSIIDASRLQSLLVGIAGLGLTLISLT